MIAVAGCVLSHQTAVVPESSTYIGGIGKRTVPFHAGRRCEGPGRLLHKVRLAKLTSI